MMSYYNSELMLFYYKFYLKMDDSLFTPGHADLQI
jgi:hypothetical protein